MVQHGLEKIPGNRARDPLLFFGDDDGDGVGNAVALFKDKATLRKSSVDHSRSTKQHFELFFVKA